MEVVRRNGSHILVRHFHMSHTRAGMTAYKKASPVTTVEVADENILPVDGFETIEVDLDQPGNTTKLVRMGAVTYMPGLSRNLLPTLEPMGHWEKPLIYNKTKAVLGFPGRGRSFSTFALVRDCFQQQA